MHFKGWTLYRAYDYVMRIRPYINPNPHYIRQLNIFQQTAIKPTFLQKISEKVTRHRSKPLAVVLALNNMDKKKIDRRK